VLARAKEVLTNLEKAGTDESGHPVFARAGRKHARAQLALGFQAGPAPVADASSPVLDELRQVDVNALSPLQALQILSRWKASLGGGSDEPLQ